MTLLTTFNPIHLFIKISQAILFLLTVVCLQSCKKNEEAALQLFTLMDSTGINFTNIVRDTKQDNSFLFRNFYNGGGVALGDINNDSLPDVLHTSIEV